MADQVQNFSQSRLNIFQPFTGLSSATFFNTLRQILYLLVLTKCSYTKNFDKVQGAKKIIFTACLSGKLKLSFTSPDVISSSSKSFLTSRIDFTVFCYSNSSKNITCPSGKLKTEFTSPKRQQNAPEPWAIGHYFLCTLKQIWNCKEYLKATTNFSKNILNRNWSVVKMNFTGLRRNKMST